MQSQAVQRLHVTLNLKLEIDMNSYVVRMGRAGAGSGTWTVVVHASTPDEARRIAESQNTGYSAHSVKMNR